MITSAIGSANRRPSVVASVVIETSFPLESLRRSSSSHRSGYEARRSSGLQIAHACGHPVGEAGRSSGRSCLACCSEAMTGSVIRNDTVP